MSETLQDRMAGDPKKEEQVAQSEGGEKIDRATAMRSSNPSDDKMENELEMKKANKQELNQAEDVAGRKEKGAMTGLLEKVTGKPKEPKVAD